MTHIYTAPILLSKHRERMAAGQRYAVLWSEVNRWRDAHHCFKRK